MMPDPLCRLAVQHGPHTVDVTLPSDPPIEMLLPSIVDLVGGGSVPSEEGRGWHLSRVGQARLDQTSSLRDNAVRDGELLLLTSAAVRPPASRADDPWRAVMDTADTGRVPTRNTAAGACLCAALLGATGLVWSGIVAHAAGHVVTAGVIAVGAVMGAVVARRAHADPVLRITVSVVAVMFAGVAGCLAVPGGPSTANFLLGSAVACSTAILLLRLTRCGAICLTAVATSAALTSAALAGGVVWALPVGTIGVALATLSLGVLGLAPRLSIAAAGLVPTLPTPDRPSEPDPAQQIRVSIAHCGLSGLVFGSAGAATIGTVLVAAACARDSVSWPKGAAFVAVVGLAMVLRARTHIHACRRNALAAGGLTAIAAGCASVAVSVPAQANWICLLVIAGGAAMLAGPCDASANPLARRSVEVLEYLALAAVVPLACWVSGLYALVRGLSLP
jgi:type VII secretion integral membrane protein EccD